MPGSTSPAKSVLRFVLIGIALAVAGAIVAVLAVLFVRLAVGNDSLAVLGFGIIGAVTGYMAGIIIGLAFLKRFSRWKGSVLIGAASVLVWSVAGYLVAMLFNEINLNPWIALGFFYAALPFAGLGAFLLKRRR